MSAPRDMPSPITCIFTWSLYAPDQPPCSNPPRRSSSLPPGACMTPSRVTFSSTISFRMILLRPYEYALHTNGVEADRQNGELVGGLVGWSGNSLGKLLPPEAIPLTISPSNQPTHRRSASSRSNRGLPLSGAHW